MNQIIPFSARAMRAVLITLVALTTAWQGQSYAQPNTATKDAIGFTALQDRLGVNMPTGAGIDVTQVEATDGDGDYMPDVAHSELSGRVFVNQSNTSNGVSGHATTVGRYFYGDASLAPGIGLIHNYSADDWLNNFLNFGTVNAPDPETQRIQNHSWIGSTDNTSADTSILRRFDLMIDRDNVVAVTGVNNGASSELFPLMAQAYNSIAVGRSDGNSSDGPTTLDVAGRVKPDIVAPASATSWATALVSGSAALLLETADGMGSDAALAGQAQTIKAVLMAGATKEPSMNWSHTTTQPLDLRYGAGQLNIDNSHRILTADRQAASVTQPVATTGWDFDTIAISGEMTYFFDVAIDEIIESLSIVATWHREITQLGPAFNASLANIDLRLFEADGFTLGNVIDESLSTIDNVEHIYQQDLGPGRYAIQLTSDLAWEYALAWDAQIIPEPGTGALLIVVTATLVIRRRRPRPRMPRAAA